ncbi:unnamed protein product [Adineta ricciae]|uniref:Beta-lactamase-related domain-containing protein n=1 Tax=Adineta ricciae TaxID=249248 RepID=A0A815DZF7_ADIRI|nr:unnamed protein product [Adineta ricciae]CAF1305264.1 unnamed protein product [Adineta ricciae]
MDEQSVRLLDNLVNEDYHSSGPGVAILIVINDQIVYQRCLGLANLDKEEQITPETNFRLASLTKQFTAYGIMLLEQQNRLSRNDALGRFFSMEFQRKCPYLSRDVKVQHLLEHSSGIRDYETYDSNDHSQWSDFDVLNVLTDETYFIPGTHYRYSNTGYILLGLIIETVSEQSLNQYFDENIFQPFHMNASILYDFDRTVIINRALGYIEQRNEEKYDLCDQSTTSATRGDGGIYMSLTDYLQWYYHYPILSAKPFRIDEAPLETYYYDLGWFLTDSNGKIHLHTGNSCGFTHQVFRIDDEERKVLVLYLTNLGENNQRIEKFNRLIVEKLPELNPNNTNLLWDMVGLTR